ncbi:MAG TPA: NUDIX domain-containing protein [Kiritimatiellia bacterium]|jgi:ADP-ribose pyrophosphatase YjhB (NUDIX family)|nr:NUDIX domain-containing protein [Kiritimatiellia bacterium]MBP9572466.1 NUDIX domain-containing protein [Kiritimatiellia bacterium]HOE36496.1 NUDIX domain-containing protein [Kiritimatiellia bacterium]HPK69084.1 NUDIX domain-containing protein [Kiritimatiellia bacterium]HQF20215.1 NUDIX domain-containing protein [Kiritimatiellia bacterium]
MKNPPPAIEILARGACVRAGKVLVCRNRKHGNLYLPGGHVDWGEDSRHALAREWREELGVDCRVGHFLGVIEQEYQARSGRTCEISLIFAVSCPQLSAKQNPPAAESHLEFLWIPLQQLPKSGLLPKIMARLVPQWCAQPAAAAKRWRGFSPAKPAKSPAK